MASIPASTTMSRWTNKNRLHGFALPLDSLVKEKENTNRPVAARSAGTVGKWGTTSFTSIRTPSYGNCLNTMISMIHLVLILLAFFRLCSLLQSRCIESQYFTTFRWWKPYASRLFGSGRTEAPEILQKPQRCSRWAIIVPSIAQCPSIGSIRQQYFTLRWCLFLLIHNNNYNWIPTCTQNPFKNQQKAIAVEIRSWSTGRPAFASTCDQTTKTSEATKGEETPETCQRETH